MNVNKRSLLRYGLAVAIVSAALALRVALTPIIGSGTLYITAYPAIMIVAVTLGLGPGLMSTVLSLAMIEVSFVESVGQLEFSSSLLLRATILLFAGYYVGRVGDRLRAARVRADAEASAARQALSRYLSFMEVTGQVGWTTNAAGEVVEDMPAWRKFTGQTTEAIRGWGWSEALHPDDREHMARVWRNAVEARTNYETEYRVRSRGGDYRDFLARGVPALNDDGSVREWVGTCIDITEKRRAQDALRKAHDELEIRVQERTSELNQSMHMVQAERKRFEDVLDQLPAYLVLIAPDYRVPLANRFFEERFGKADGRRCYEYLFQRAEPCEHCETFEVLKTNAPHRWEWTGPDGRDYDIYDFPFTDVGGSKLIMEVGIDITERKKAEAELEKHRHHLEELVRERTAQLEAANAQFQEEIVVRRQAEEALRASRMAALNLMEDAVEARRQIEQASVALRRSRDRSELLAETMGALLQSNEPQHLVETLCTRVMEHLECQAFFNFLADVDVGRLRLNAYAGIPPEEALALEWLDYGVAVCGCAAAERCRIVAEHIPTTYDPRTDLVRSFGIKAYACHPLLGPGNKVIGTLSFGARNRETFNEDDLALMKSVADHVAVAMDRVNAEHALRRAHDELEQRVEERTADLRRVSLYARSLIEASLDPMVTINPDGQITDVNRATELATGRSRSELIGSDFSDYFTQPDKARESYQRVLAEGQVTDYPLTIRHTSGGTMDVLYNATAYRDEAGEVRGVFAAARDVTERNRIEKALRNSEKLLAEAQRIAHLGGWDWNVVGDELSWSDEMFRLFGFEPQAFPVNYARFLQCVHPEDHEVVMDRVNRALDGVDDYEVRYRIIRPDTTERILHAQAEVVFDESGVPIRMVGTVLDITEQVRAEEEAKLRQQQLVQADKMVSLGILVSGVAHEINNPNHSIMSNVTLLKDVWDDARPILDRFRGDFGDFVLGGFDYVASRDKFSDMFANALAGARRIELIVTELRDFARYSPKEKMAPMDVNTVLESSVVLMSNMIHKSTDRFVVHHEPVLPPVLGNMQRIEQVVINLIQNACQSLPGRDKSITVSTSYVPETQAVTIEVRDEGAGIPEEDLRHMGDPFFTTKRASGGMGLGLWVSFNIVHEHGGTLTFFSRGGEGTRAVLSLPVSEEAQGPEHAELSREEQG